MGRLEQGQDSPLRREAVQRRVLQRLQHICGDDTGSVDGCVRPRVDPAGPVDARTIEQAAARRRPRVLHAALRTELLVARLTERVAAPQRLDGAVDRILRVPDPGLFEHDAGLQLVGFRELHHRFARHQGRHDRWLGHELANVRAEGQHQHADHGQRLPRAARLSVPGRRVQHADDGHPEGEQRLRQLRAGHVDHEPAHAELRRALRPFQRRGAGRVRACVDLDRGARLPRDSERAELERLVGAARRRLRRLRQRQNGVQSECRQVRRLTGGWLRADLQRDERRNTNAHME